MAIFILLASRDVVFLAQYGRYRAGAGSGGKEQGGVRCGKPTRGARCLLGMSDNRPLEQFWAAAKAALAERSLLKLTLSKPSRKTPDRPRNLYARLVELRGEDHIQVTHRYGDREEAKNYAPAAGITYLREQLGGQYLNGDLFTTGNHCNVTISRKGNARLTTRQPFEAGSSNTCRHPPNRAQNEENIAGTPTVNRHDRAKERIVAADRPYLQDLGITNREGVVLPTGKRKFKQINKFVEVIDGLVRNHPLPADAHIVDMGSGSGYLTFALYDHLVNHLKLSIHVTGVELRPKLVDKCNTIARERGFSTLRFVEGSIDSYRPAGIDMLIALHACDTATDDALAQGVHHNAEIMVVAPCCQKQVRRDMDVPPDLKPFLGHGILLERQAAMLTDGLRALYLQAEGYQTKLFEFIPLEHTAKNVMITAVKGRRDVRRAKTMEEIDRLKETFGVMRHRLEELLTGSRSTNEKL